jgi:hypothetical protein
MATTRRPGNEQLDLIECDRGVLQYLVRPDRAADRRGAARGIRGPAWLRFPDPFDLPTAASQVTNALGPRRAVSSTTSSWRTRRMARLRRS